MGVLRALKDNQVSIFGDKCNKTFFFSQFIKGHFDVLFQNFNHNLSLA